MLVVQQSELRSTSPEGACYGLVRRSYCWDHQPGAAAWQAMTSRLLRHGLRPACRLHLHRPSRESRALLFAAASPDRASSQQITRIPHAAGTAAWCGTRTWSTVVAGTSADVVGGRVCPGRLPLAMSALLGDGCCWRGGGVALYRASSGARWLSGGRSTSSSQK